MAPYCTLFPPLRDNVQRSVPECSIAYFIIPCFLLSELFASSIFCFNLFYFLLEHFTSLIFHVYSFTCIIPPLLMKCVHYCPVRQHGSTVQLLLISSTRHELKLAMYRMINCQVSTHKLVGPIWMRNVLRLVYKLIVGPSPTLDPHKFPTRHSDSRCCKS